MSVCVCVWGGGGAGGGGRREPAAAARTRPSSLHFANISSTCHVVATAWGPDSRVCFCNVPAGPRAVRSPCSILLHWQCELILLWPAWLAAGVACLCLVQPTLRCRQTRCSPRWMRCTPRHRAASWHSNCKWPVRAAPSSAMPGWHAWLVRAVQATLGLHFAPVVSPPQQGCAPLKFEGAPAHACRTPARVLLSSKRASSRHARCTLLSLPPART